MKITKSQLKQIIKEELKEELNEAIGGDRDVEWLTADEMRKSPPSASVRRAVGPKKYPETEGDYSMGLEPEEENFRTVDYMINFYQEKPRVWQMAVNQYHDMAHGQDPDGIRSEMYPHWSDEDFAEVIRTISPRGEY
jgi:hypothetical protein